MTYAREFGNVPPTGRYEWNQTQLAGDLGISLRPPRWARKFQLKKLKAKHLLIPAAAAAAVVAAPAVLPALGKGAAGVARFAGRFAGRGAGLIFRGGRAAVRGATAATLPFFRAEVERRRVVLLAHGRTPGIAAETAPGPEPAPVIAAAEPAPVAVVGYRQTPVGVPPPVPASFGLGPQTAQAAEAESDSAAFEAARERITGPLTPAGAQQLMPWVIGGAVVALMFGLLAARPRR